MASRAPRTASAPPAAVPRSEPTEFVRAAERATQIYLDQLARAHAPPPTQVPQSVAQIAQQTIGNEATAEHLVRGTEDRERIDVGPEREAAERLREEEEAKLEKEEEEELLPDPEQPDPADPAEDPDLEDEEATASDAPPEHASASAEEAGIAQPRQSGAAPAVPAAGGAVAIPTGGGAGAVAQAAVETASRLPGPPPPASVASRTSAARPARRRPTRRRIAGPPPVPTVEPEFEGVRDPIEPATQEIERIAARTLAAQNMPPVPASPGGNTVTVPDRTISPSDLRLVEMGEAAMDRAELSREGGTKLPGESEAGETRARLLAIRQRLLSPEAAEASPPQAGETAPPRPGAPVTPREGAETADAEAAAPGAFTINPRPLPPTDMTVAEQEMFTTVIANLKARGEGGAKRALDQIKRGMTEYPNGVLTREGDLDQLGMGLLPDLERDMNVRVDSVASVLGTAGAVLDSAVASRREALQHVDEERLERLEASARLDLLTIEGTAQARLDDAAAAREQAAEARRRAAAAGRAPNLGFRQVAEAAVRRIQAKVSEAIARFRFEKTERHTALDAARGRWLSAVDLAALADQFAAERLHHLEPGATHPPSIPLSARRAVSAAINRAQHWRAEQVTFIDVSIRDMKSSADTEMALNILDVQTAGADAFRALRDRGNAQDGATEQWWQDQVANLDSWAENATDTANTWAETESRLARLQLQRAAQAARGRIERELSDDEAAKTAYLKLTEGERRNFIARNILNSNVLIHQIGSPIRDNVAEANKDRVTRQVETELFALPRQKWEALNAAARAKNSGFDAEQRANRIKSAGVDEVGTSESAIFTALSGLRRIERLAVTAAYNCFRGSDNALYNDLDSELSGDEWRRAEALMAGRHGEAAAEAIHDAVFGPGTGEAQIYEALETINRLPEPERTEALAQADEVYSSRYGESLSSRLRGDLSGSERDRALALAAGNMREAEAHEMNHALSSRDADAAAAVYERIRSEEYERARREGWSPARYEAAVADRNAALQSSFQEHYANVGNYRWGDASALENAIGYQFAFDEGSRHRLTGFATGDLAGVSAGRMRAEERSAYADDEVVGNIVVDQHRYAADVVELERGPEMRAAVSRRLDLEVRRREDAGDSLTAEQIENRRMELEREMQARMADAAFDRARENVNELDQRLQDRYGITLNDMITNTMSDNVFGDGGDLTNARARLDIMRRDESDPGALADRRIDWAYTRIRHGIEGAGTNLDELRGGMSGLTREEMLRLDARWRVDHGGESLRGAIESDTSGREEDDLVDLFEHGAPQTVADQVDELRRRLARDEASVGFVGAWASEDHSARSRERLARLEALAERMRDPSLTPNQRENITAAFGEQRTSVENAIEAQRERVDAYADMVTTVLSYVVGALTIIAAAVLTVLSGGTLSPLLAGAIALTGSLVGTVAGIAAKAAIKGGAYGMEEIGTDVAVGLVDLAVTMATAGLLKGGAVFRNARALLSGVMEEVKVLGRQSVRVGMRAAGEQVAKAGVGRAARTAGGATAREATERGAAQRLLTAGRAYAREQAIDAASAIPATLTANVLNEENWRHGNVAGNILRGTWEGSLQNLRDGVIMGAGARFAHRGAAALIHAEPLTPRQTHERDIRHWRHAHPDASPADYAAFVEAYSAAHSGHADVVRAAQREARRSLLSEIPPRERAAVADVPIIHVNEAQFRLFNNGNFGDAFVHVQNGQAVIIIRDGAPASALSRIAPQLRDIVAPGTRGRTVNPADALPPRLRNRVEVEVVRDPAFGADEVRAVPQRDRDGNIVGVALQVGPNARAIDIQLHVGTVDAMRRYAGLGGQVRQFMNRMGRRVGMDIIDPSQRGRWEAQLEVAKLPAIIEERIARLSERGLDPRRRALVFEEIANLERQFMREVQRAEMGLAAEERGFVAAQPKKPVVQETPEAVAQRHEAMAQNAELRRLATSDAEVRRQIDEIDRPRDNFIEMADRVAGLADEGHRTLIGHEQTIDRVIDLLADNNVVAAADLLDVQFRGLPREQVPPAVRRLLEFGEAARKAEARRAAVYPELAQRLAELDAQIGELRRQIDENAYSRLAGGDRMPMHNSLPVPLAGWNYFPEPPPNKQLSAGEQQALQNNRNGFIAELRLANLIAESGGIVLMYGHKVNEHGADLVSFDPATGRLTLWDSKYRGRNSSGDSQTFAEGGRRDAAVQRIQQFLLIDPRAKSLGLSADQLATIREALANGDFDMVTAHTTGGGFTLSRMMPNGS